MELPEQAVQHTGGTRQPTTETEVNMAIINLRDYYPFYTSDYFMEVSEEVAEMFKEFDRTGIFNILLLV